MNSLADFEAFIFDMDGLVLDTEPAYFEAWRLALEAMGYKTDVNFFRSFSGNRFAQIQDSLVQVLGADFDIQSFKALAGQYWRNHVDNHGIAVKTGVIELLDFAEEKGIPVCLATNSPSFNARECLTISGIKHRFPYMVTGDEVARPKPAPDIFFTAADRLGVDIRRCIVFEDSHTGIVAASSAGAYCAYIPSTLPVDPYTVELCDRLFNDLSQLFQSLAKPSINGI